MRILVVRHAESANNVLSMVSYDLYMSNRSNDPKLTDNGVDQVNLVYNKAKKIGCFLKEKKFKIDKSMSTIMQFIPVAHLEQFRQV